MDDLWMGIESILTGANEGLALEVPGMASVLADQLRGLLDLHEERIRGHITVSADEKAKEVRLERDDREARTLRVVERPHGQKTVQVWELSTGVGPGSVHPGPIAAVLAEWLR